jgi:transposase
MKMANSGDKLRALCVGHPHAKIAWPHRDLHEAAKILDQVFVALRDFHELAYPENAMHAHTKWVVPGATWRLLGNAYADLKDYTDGSDPTK